MPDSQLCKSEAESSDSGSYSSKESAATREHKNTATSDYGTELVRHGWRNKLTVSLIHSAFACRLARTYDRRVHRLGGSTIIKWASRTRAAEAFAMEFVRRATHIPVPRVLAVLTGGGAQQQQQQQQTYIVMEFVEGAMLADVWPDLSADQKRDIVAQLRGYLLELRALRPAATGGTNPDPKQERIEAIDGSACFDSRLGGDLGPFDSITAFHTHLGHDYILHSASAREEYPSFQDAFTRVSTKRYRTAFTHGDFALHNVLVRGTEIVSIIDWESAGWYPEYWEYTRGVDSNQRYPEFMEMFRKGDVIEPYAEELEVEKMLASVFVRS